MSQKNGEKARASIAKRNRTATRAKNRAKLAQLKANSSTKKKA